MPNSRSGLAGGVANFFESFINMPTSVILLHLLRNEDQLMQHKRFQSINLLFVFLVAASLAACARETSNDRDSSPSADNGSAEDGGVEAVSLDYVLLVEFRMASDDIVKEEATVMFRGMLGLCG